MVPAQSHVAEQMGTFADYPPRQKPAKFNVEEVLNNLKKAKSAD
jgi:arylsulfatase